MIDIPSYYNPDDEPSYPSYPRSPNPSDSEPPPPHECVCPSDNFRFNGIGCQCGGT